MEWFELYGITPVPILYDGIFDEKVIRSLWDSKKWDTMEGYVVRVADEIKYSDFRYKVMKFVRRGHVATGKHWMHGQRIEPNELKDMK
jgi:hypothetical protein